MQGEGKRPQPPLHEQLSPPAGIPPHHPLSTPPSSLTTPLPLKKKKLLKVILKSPPTPNPNRLSPSLSSSPSSPHPSPPPPSLSTPLLPHHHHNLQQHQLHHHQQLLLQQQHLHKQKLLQQQTQQLASELQLKLHQQHLLQQEHPKLLEQFKQQLQQEQICASTSELQVNSQWQASSASKEQRRNLKGQSSQQETCEFQEKGRFLQDDRKDPSSRRRHGRSGELTGDAPPEESFSAHKSRFQSEGGGAHVLQGNAQKCHKDFRPNGQEQQAPENFQKDGEPSSKRLKQDPEGNHFVRSSLRSPSTQHHKLAPHASLKDVPEDPITGSHGLRHALKLSAVSSNGLLPPPGLASESSSAAILDASEARRLKHTVDPGAWNGLPSFAEPDSEGVGLKDGTATGPLSKTLGGSGNASVPGKKVLRGVLDKLQKKDSYGAFAEPVDVKEVPDYYDVIKEPMDFGTMRKRISAGYYTSLELFEKDIFAICSNAMTFNAAGTVYHRQARAIKTAAERILEPLKTSGGSAVADEAQLKQKVVSQVKKSHKKKQPWKSWTSDYVSEPSRNMGGRGAGRASAACLADSYYVDWQAGIGHTSNNINTEDKEDATGYLAKSLGLNDGRRLSLNEESRRGTYKPISNDGSGSLVATVTGGPLQFVPAAFQLDFSYARSLARFAADLGPDVWKVAGEKIRRALPMGVPFGPGWVGQREASGRSFSLMNKSMANCSTDSTGKAENVLNKVGVRVGSSCVSDGAVGSIDSRGVVITVDQNSNSSFVPDHDCPGTLVVNHRPTEERQLIEMAHVSQAAPQVSFGGGVRDTEHLRSCDGDRGSRQMEILYPSQAVCQGGAREIELLPNCEGDPVLIPGRDLEGRMCVEYKNGRSSVLHLNPVSGLISTSGAPSEGLQTRLNEDG